MIGAVHNRTENVAFGARFSRKSIEAINNGLYDLSHRGTNVSTEEIAQYTNQFDLIKKDLAATGVPGVYMFKYDGGGIFIQFEATNRYKKAYFSSAMPKVSSSVVVQFPPEQLHRLAEFLKKF